MGSEPIQKVFVNFIGEICLSLDSWLQNQSLDTTDYLSERIYALSVAGTDKDILISYLDELVSAWGGYNDYQVNNLDTALALLALKRINFSDQTIISSALGFLLSTQNPDGGWGFYPSACSNCDVDPSNVYMTAMVLRTPSQYRTIYNFQPPIHNAAIYLLTKQNPDSGLGQVLPWSVKKKGRDIRVKLERYIQVWARNANKQICLR